DLEEHGAALEYEARTSGRPRAAGRRQIQRSRSPDRESSPLGRRRSINMETLANLANQRYQQLRYQGISETQAIAQTRSEIGQVMGQAEGRDGARLRHLVYHGGDVPVLQNVGVPVEEFYHRPEEVAAGAEIVGDYADEHHEGIETALNAAAMIPSLAGRAAAAARWGFGAWRFGRQAPEVAPTPPANNNPRLAAPPEAATPAPAEKPALREGQMGTYKELYDMRVPGDNLTPNHMPQAAYMKQYGVKKPDGIAMMMEQPVPGAGGRHRQTRTYGRKPDLSTDPRTELAKDIMDARKIYQQDGLYTPEIRQGLQKVIDANKNIFPDIFAKKVQ
ncbi:MAG: hypothetical protein WCG04_07500, partial [Alphaproteobacteria bacterium]